MIEKFNISRALSVARKEIMHILRDPFTLGMAIGIPIVFVIFFGFAIDFDFKGIKLSVFDFDHSRQSRELVSVFSSSGYFVPSSGYHLGNPISDVESERSFMALIINPGFGKKIVSGEGDKVQLLMDGTDNRKAGAVNGYVAGINQAVIRRLTGAAYKSPIDYETRFLYNPELNTKWFIVPGLIVIIIGLLSILMTALTVAREWENGSMELLLSTPVTPLEIVILHASSRKQCSFPL
ncbi:MAG: ABC transporter permease [Elusimicrobia bacterium]|nr:ABC transporter permease [Elusimicrobiota bacterium]